MDQNVVEVKIGVSRSDARKMLARRQALENGERAPTVACSTGAHREAQPVSFWLR
jgi:hypothetical protein